MFLFLSKESKFLFAIRTGRQTLDLIQKGCFDQVTTGRHSLLSRHKFLGSLEMKRKFVGPLITVLKRAAHQTQVGTKCLTLATSVKVTLSMPLQISSGGQ